MQTFLRFFIEIGLASSWTGLVLAHLIIVMPFALRLTLASAIGIDQRQEHAATPGTETLPVPMFLYIQDSIDPLVTSVCACVIAFTAVLLAILDRLFGLEALLLGYSSERRS